jgi:hypothetical protein
MRNHTLVEEIASKMITYNNTEYLIDLDEIISLNKYGNPISTLLIQIKNILTTDLNTNINIKITKNSIKRYIYQILLFENGEKCFMELIQFT